MKVLAINWALFVIMIINLTLRSNMINIMMIRKYVLEQMCIRDSLWESIRCIIIMEGAIK